MGDVAERIRQGKISYKDGLRELENAGMHHADADDFLRNVTDPIHRKQS